MICSNTSAQTIDIDSNDYSISYAQAPQAVIDVFEDAGHDVPTNATFSLVPVAADTASLQNTDDMALCMTVRDGNSESKTVVLSLGTDISGNLFVDNTPTYLLRAQPRRAPRIAFNKINMSGTAYRDVISDYYYFARPKSCSFSYGRTAASSSSSIVYAGVSYYIEGTACPNAPSFTGSYYSSHTINCTRNYPIEGTTYSNSNPSSVYISPYAGKQILTYMCTVDGVYDSYVVSL